MVVMIWHGACMPKATTVLDPKIHSQPAIVVADTTAVITPVQPPSNLADMLARIIIDYPDVQFVASSRYSWHAGHRHVSYCRKSSGNTMHDMFSLLHELGHALLQHKDYTHDIELLQLEVTAWEQAAALASRYDLKLDDDYVQDCLDTYRDWLHLRATCPTCYGRSLQSDRNHYHCFNCQTEWQVSRSRLCRPYRLKTPQTA
jgi:hypothetical protein